MAILLLAIMAVPQLAFWLVVYFESYLARTGLFGAIVSTLAPSWFLIPFLFICQLIVLTAGWSRLTVRERMIAVLLALLPVPALVLPILLAFSF